MSFHIVERDLGGWLYSQIRPNLGTVSGGAFVYDTSAHLSWELPWFAYQHHQPLPDPLDLRDVSFRTGVTTRVIEPGMAYELGYRFRDQDEFVADLRFDGLTPPVPHLQGAPPFTGSSHYDQHGRITGTLRLRGEEMTVDCVSVRDRSWGRRPERVGRGRRLSYAFGHTDADEAFLAFSMPSVDEPSSDVESFVSGYLLRGGVLRRLERGTRTVARDAATGGVSRIELSGIDTDGRELAAVGQARSRMFLGLGGVTVNTVMRWTTDLGVGHGEDQDVWPQPEFADARRLLRGDAGEGA